jgi:RNA polymerase sigma-70 factor (ECF subfamily)
MTKLATRRDQVSDQELVQLILNGCPEDFDRLHERYRKRIFAFALRRVTNPSDAEDITQEVLIQIYRSLPSYQGRASLATWIFGIAHNVTCRYYRSRGAPTVSFESLEDSIRLTVVPQQERNIDAKRTVEKCTRTLEHSRTPEHLEIFRLFYGMGHPLRQIASATNRPTDNVKDSLRRSRNMLLRDVPDVRHALVASS